MSITLAVDASTYVGTVAVLRDGMLVSEMSAAMRGEREERLMPAVAAALRAANVEVREIATVVCGAGPGSFTSLRIAAAIAKGLVASIGARLCAVPSLALAIAGTSEPLSPGNYVAVLDAMRGECFAQAMTIDEVGCLAMLAPYVLMPAASIDAFVQAHDARLLDSKENRDGLPHARGVARLQGNAALIREVAIASWQPDYGRLAEAQVKWEAVHGRALDGR